MAVDFKVRCLNPQVYRYDSDGNPSIMYPCGKCELCKAKKRNQWANRMVCESVFAKSVFFVTLTYEDSQLKYKNDIPTLCKRDYYNFIKRLRSNLPFKIRFYGCGEYGSESNRPHYHLNIWCPSYISKSKFRAYVTKSWKLGFNTVKDANVQRFQYIAKYTTKLSGDLLGVEKPFSSCSQNPPIGYQYFALNNPSLTSNYFVTPSFKKSTLPRSFENKIRQGLSLEDEIYRRDSIRFQSSLLLRQYVIDFNKIGPAKFNNMRDEIERRVKTKNYKLSKI